MKECSHPPGPALVEEEIQGFRVFGPASVRPQPPSPPLRSSESDPFQKKRAAAWKDIYEDQILALQDTAWLAERPLNEHLHFVYERLHKTRAMTASVLAQYGPKLPYAAWTLIREVWAALLQYQRVTNRALALLNEIEPEAKALQERVGTYEHQIHRARKRVKRRKQEEWVPAWMRDSGLKGDAHPCSGQPPVMS